MWVIPFFLWAVLLACWEWWFVAGLVMGLAAMFKGQQMFIAVVFLLWPLFAGQPGRALRWLAGFGLAASLVISPWMLSYRTDFTAPERIFDWPAFGTVLGCTVAVTVAAWFVKRISRRTRGCIVAGALAASLLLCILLFHASMAWWKLGFLYGTERHPNMVVGPGNNLGALLDARFGFHDPKEIVWTIPAKAILGWPSEEVDVQLRYILFGIFLVSLVVSCIAIARQWRRQDRRFLIAILTPWILFYSIPLQIHDRYLLFAAVPAAILIGLGVGPALLGIFLTVLTFLQTAESAMGSNPMLMGNYYHPLFNLDFVLLCRRLRPDISWAVLAIAGVFFFSSFMTSRWRKGDTGSIKTAPKPPSRPDGPGRTELDLRIPKGPSEAEDTARTQAETGESSTMQG